MANSWAQQAGAYYRTQRKTRSNLKFSDALKELSKLRKSGKMSATSIDVNNQNVKSKSRKSNSRRSRRRSRRSKSQ